MRYLMLLLITLLGVACTTETTNVYEERNMGIGITGQGDNIKTGWSSAGVLTAGSKTDEVRLQADFPEPYSYCIEFSKSAAIPQNPPIAQNVPLRAEAEISWSVEGNFVTRRISIANGTTIQGVAQAVKVRIIDATVSSISDLGTSTHAVKYNVSLQVTRGTRGSTSHPPVLLPRTSDGNHAFFNCFLLPAGPTSIDIPIPADAGPVSVNINGIPLGAAGAPKAVVPGAITVNFSQGGNILQTYNYTDQSPSQFIAIVPGTDTVTVNINAATDPALTAFVFTTLLGIDG